MTAKAADELHLTFKEQWKWKDDDWNNPNREKEILIPLAFANAYEPNKKGWEKKLQTQMDWAYGHDTWEKRDDGIYTHTREWKKRLDGGHEQVVVSSTRVADYLQPKIIKNDPVSGFKISHSVSRYSTSNKLWRIQDPRGFELEINTGNMEEILMNHGVLKGEIQGTYQWVGKTLTFTNA